ncbi:MAG TPA: hypothetical protein VK581_03105 [Chthoniobacterales bacterium]|nr:hypothetical protein [Chthoniobacterales bacterium]
MFEPLQKLGTELDGVVAAAKASHNKNLEGSVHRFVVDVGREAEKAFSDVYEVLGEIAFLKPSELNEDKVRELQARLANTYSREKFKVAQRICDALHVLSDRFHKDIEPHLTAAGAVPHSSQLFLLLDKHEGAFIYIIQNAVPDILSILDDYKTGKDIDAGRARARQAQQELKAALDHVTRAHHEVLGALPSGASRLLDPGGVADEILRRSPWFSGAFYLSAAVVLLTALTIVAGNVKPLMFPLVVGGAFVGLTLIGALQLRNDGRLSEENFVKLIDLALRRVLLPLTKKK